MEELNSKINLSWANVLHEYFESHIKQRFLFINYFILITTSLVIAAYFSHKICGSKKAQVSALIFLGFLMAVITFIFWNLERRVKFLIKRCNKRLIKLEDQLLQDSSLKLFSKEHEETEEERKKRFGYFLSNSKCINLLLASSFVSYIILLILIGFFSDPACKF